MPIPVVGAEVEASMRPSNSGSSFMKTVHAAGIFPRNGPDPTARSWGHHRSGVTFAAQDKLPKLPVPTLESSCLRYLEALRPLQSAQEHEASATAVQTFLQGEGPILQAQLKEYDRCQANYFEHFCYESFLGDDSPVVLNSNAFCAFEDDPDPSRNDQISRAASLVRSTVVFSQAIREDRLPIDETRGRPLCMNQYWWLFGVARVPADDGGRVRMDPDARHVAVLCRGQFYRLYVMDDCSNRIIDEHDLRQSLHVIVIDAHTRSTQDVSNAAVGLLTTENQKVWSRCRQILVHEGLQNGRNLGIIDSSLFVLCLDDSSPSHMSDVCRNMICGTDVMENGVQIGTCINRWYDKLALIVCRNGAAGMNFEHTCTDGSVDIGMACDIYKGSIVPSESNAATLPNGHSHANGTFHRWQKLNWDIPSEVSDALRQAERHLVDRIRRHELETLDFREYGKSSITSMGFSPDAFFQMALQAAYYRAYAQIRSGFEPVQMRQFLHGRTDVMRTTTAEAAAFARLFSDENASSAEKIDAMHLAADVHVAKAKECAKGLSHHRHLSVLQQLWKRRRAFIEVAGLITQEQQQQQQQQQEQQHAPPTTIFTDPGWTQLGTTILMGSNVENPSLAYAGFGPAADDGFTVCYFIRGDHMRLSICSRNGEAKRFRNVIERTLRDLRDMINDEERKKEGKKEGKKKQTGIME